MEIESYNIGDKIVAIERRVELIKCPKCKGKPRIIYDNITYQCECCEGIGEVYSKEKWIVIKPFKKITRILIDVDNEGKKDIRYFTNSQIPTCIGKKEDCFISEEDAIKECEKRNKGESK